MNSSSPVTQAQPTQSIHSDMTKPVASQADLGMILRTQANHSLIITDVLDKYFPTTTILISAKSLFFLNILSLVVYLRGLISLTITIKSELLIA